MKVLVSAFTCGPSGASEPGAGWGWAVAAARENDVWVLTRLIPADRLEEVIAEQAAVRLRVVYLDPPAWIRRWFRGGLGLRLSYIAWQRRAAKVARRLDHEIGFDLVHHVTFANIWLPTGVAAVEAPFVLGPVGGGPRVALRMWPELGLRGAAMELARISAQLCSRLNPSVRRSWRRARIILVQNEETRRALPRRHRPKCHLRQHAVTSAPPAAVAGAEQEDAVGSTGSRRLAVFAGRLVAWKGPCLAVAAIGELEGWDLVVIGSGPELPRLRRLVQAGNAEDRITFVPWVPRDALQGHLAQADVVVVPSLRDDSPFIVAEAQALGRPVAGFDQGGLAAFAALAGTAIELAPLPRNRHQAATSLAAAITRAGATNTPPTGESFSIDRIVRDLRGIYAEAVAPATGPAGIPAWRRA